MVVSPDGVTVPDVAACIPQIIFSRVDLCLHDKEAAKESLADKEKLLELDKELIEKLKEQGKTAEAKKLATLDKIFKNEVEDIKFVLENKHLYFLK